MVEPTLVKQRQKSAVIMLTTYQRAFSMKFQRCTVCAREFATLDTRQKLDAEFLIIFQVFCL